MFLHRYTKYIYVLAMCCTPACYRFDQILAQVKVNVGDWLTE